jgi:hypothetical protein
VRRDPFSKEPAGESACRGRSGGRVILSVLSGSLRVVHFVGKTLTSAAGFLKFQAALAADF